jgi:hypothetical protein
MSNFQKIIDAIMAPVERLTDEECEILCAAARQAERDGDHYTARAMREMAETGSARV